MPTDADARFDDLASPARRGHVRRARPRDHRARRPRLPPSPRSARSSTGAASAWASSQTLVNPGVPIPPFITVLTGHHRGDGAAGTADRRGPAALLEFIGTAVLVGHNVRFDPAFLDAALTAHGYPPLGARLASTRVALARRLVHDEIAEPPARDARPPLRTPTEPDPPRARRRPRHRRPAARAARTGRHARRPRPRRPARGPRGRGPARAGEAQARSALPAAPGVLVFRDVRGRVLYVGRATNLRAAVLDYFAGNDRQVCRAPAPDLRHRHVVCADPAGSACVRGSPAQAHDPPLIADAEARGRALRRAPAPAPGPASAHPRP